MFLHLFSINLEFYVRQAHAVRCFQTLNMRHFSGMLWKWYLSDVAAHPKATIATVKLVRMHE